MTPMKRDCWDTEFHQPQFQSSPSLVPNYINPDFHTQYLKLDSRSEKCCIATYWAVFKIIWSPKSVVWKKNTSISLCIKINIQIFCRRELWKETWVQFQYAIRRIIVRSHAVSKPRDLCLELCDRSEIWQVHRQRCCRGVCQISKLCNDSDHQFSRDPAIRRLIAYWEGA